ncbi:uncharacterized protein LOC128228616 [Mya arenaria]|uniref:uncharacterized protein LOC128228616 n=1 Tax=Mya arenaria TaxID=6604 RepID=UPI0022E6955F|nr:uncharacterized protein LOC128228616 [Mya arenaria]
MVQDGSIGFPDPQPFPNDTVNMPFFLVVVVRGDALSLSEHMQKPYGQRSLTGEEIILNYRLSRARRVSENAFGILADRFQILISKMNHSPSTVRLIFKTCCILHNLMRMRYPTLQNEEDRRGDLVLGGMEERSQLGGYQDCQYQGL